jgi:hypothetical protein
MSRQWLTAPLRAVLGVALTAGLLLFVPAAAQAQAPDVQRPAPELTANWWQTFLAIPGDPLGRCDLTGPRNIIFLAGTGGGTATRNCTIPTGSSLLVPLINVECSQVEGNGNNFPELRKCANGLADDFTDLSLVIDGKKVPGLTRLRVQSNLFTFRSVAGNAFNVPATPRTISVADGYWALIRPLSPGRHTITFGGSYPPGPFSTLATYNLTVRPRHT